MGRCMYAANVPSFPQYIGVGGLTCPKLSQSRPRTKQVPAARGDEFSLCPFTLTEHISQGFFPSKIQS